jgi:hypothetical protein
MKPRHSEAAFGAAFGADVPLFGGRGIPLRFSPERGDTRVLSFRAPRRSARALARAPERSRARNLFFPSAKLFSSTESPSREDR